ncbi:MAG: hypothetical protein QOG52_501 [Frankiaceae bacterium]|nr:hypothetical protein [Frankiaceae bacterium]
MCHRGPIRPRVAEAARLPRINRSCTTRKPADANAHRRASRLWWPFRLTGGRCARGICRRGPISHPFGLSGLARMAYQVREKCPRMSGCQPSRGCGRPIVSRLVILEGTVCVEHLACRGKAGRRSRRHRCSLSPCRRRSGVGRAGRRARLIGLPFARGSHSCSQRGSDLYGRRQGRHGRLGQRSGHQR